MSFNSDICPVERNKSFNSDICPVERNKSFISAIYLVESYWNCVIKEAMFSCKIPKIEIAFNDMRTPGPAHVRSISSFVEC